MNWLKIKCNVIVCDILCDNYFHTAHGGDTLCTNAHNFIHCTLHALTIDTTRVIVQTSLLLMSTKRRLITRKYSTSAWNASVGSPDHLKQTLLHQTSKQVINKTHVICPFSSCTITYLPIFQEKKIILSGNRTLASGCLD